MNKKLIIIPALFTFVISIGNNLSDTNTKRIFLVMKIGIELIAIN